MTWIEVVDTSVKIGLSAAIAGISAFFIGKRSQAHELRKERMRRIHDSLEEVSREFEAVHSSFLDRCSTSFHVQFTKSTMREKTKDPWELANAALKESKSMLLKLHQLEGRLLLLDLGDCAVRLREYRVAATKIEEVPIAAPNAVTRLEPLAEALCQQKLKIYEALAREHKIA